MAHAVVPRVLHVMAGETHGGAENYFLRAVAALHHAGVPQRVIIRRDNYRAGVLERQGITPVQLPFDNVFDPSTRGRIREEMRDFGPNIVQTWMYQATSATPPSGAVHVGWLRGYQHLRDYRYCDHLIAMSRGVMASVIQQGWPAERIHHIRPFAEDARKPAVDRAKYDTPADAFLLLALGRLHWHKAFDTLLQVMPQLPDAYLWIAGEGDQRHNLEGFSRDLQISDRVRFLGWQEDRAPLYAAADVCVVPSRYEPFGLVVIETWAQGKPLILTKAAGSRATVQNEVDGLLVPIDDVDAMAQAARRLQTDRALREGIARRGYAHFQRDYTEKTSIDQYLELYNQVLQMGLLANRRLSRLDEWRNRVLSKLGV